VGSTIHDDGGQQTRAVPAAKGERLLSVNGPSPERPAMTRMRRERPLQ
jgi:hypothetical protein